VNLRTSNIIQKSIDSKVWIIMWIVFWIYYKWVSMFQCLSW